jgi:hypothetical protein
VYNRGRGAVVSWFTFHRSGLEALTAAEDIRANYRVFLQRPDWPRETAAAFLRYDVPTSETYFYLSPAFVEAEPFMVQRYQADSCAAPKREVGLALLVGQFGAMGLLDDNS